MPLAHAVVCGDVKVEVFHQSPFGKKKLKLGFWFHTGFVEGNRLLMKKSELDKAFKDKKHRAFPCECAVALSHGCLLADPSCCAQPICQCAARSSSSPRHRHSSIPANQASCLPAPPPPLLPLVTLLASVMRRRCSLASGCAALGNQATAASSIPSPAMELGKPELMRVLFDYDVPDAGHL